MVRWFSGSKMELGVGCKKYVFGDGDSENRSLTAC